jgi:20S proteasome alpha/beta subunit
MVEQLKTGTTCIALQFKDGVIIGADRRMTAGFIASDKASKVYELSKYIVGTTAGHAADNQRVMRYMASELKLLQLRVEREPKVKEAAMLLNSIQYSIVRQQGSIVSVILGGYDEFSGFSLYNLSPDGTIVPHDGYVVDGSGSIYVKGVLDMEYKPNLSEKEAIALVEKGFQASFKNDNASGGGFIVKIITKDGIKEVSRKIVQTTLVSEEK